ncbi:hypothetical protein POM88_040430 [Heracleum sosnowskyi]|uniref:Uncharacterized protein n=1 Tax=Heracleum sosnowskyi TaxID=360622 RepID=A0AAD8HCY9_9APIA|nr:hypothetical protein POM88_040430 [Heracleum sosnowskyi]
MCMLLMGLRKSWLCGKILEDWLLFPIHGLPFQRERTNCSTRPREMREFNSWIEDSNLLEIPLENANFTWIGPNGKRSRLYRAFSNSEWPNLDDWNLKALSRKNSDHRGILLRAKQQNWGPKPFRVFNVWLRNSKLNKELEDHFSKSSGLPNLYLQQKLRNVKHIIKTWNLSMNGNIFQRISELEDKVAKLEEENGPRNELAILKMSMEELCLIRDSMLKQKARVEWLKEGDRNSKRIHQAIQKRRARNSIKKLLCNGRLSSDPLEIKQEAKEHFQQVFRKRKEFNIFSIKDKAPRPDGLNAGTLKALWRYLKDDMLAFVKNFMSTGEIPFVFRRCIGRAREIWRLDMGLGPLDARFQVVEEDVAEQVVEEEVEGMGEWLVQDLG